jgi:hypothetical protein
MNEQGPPALDPELRALLVSERDRRPVTPDVSARLFARLQHTVGMPADTSAEASRAPHEEAVRSATPAGGLGSNAWRRVPWGQVVAAFVLGSAVGSGLMWRFTHGAGAGRADTTVQRPEPQAAPRSVPQSAAGPAALPTPEPRSARLASAAEPPARPDRRASRDGATLPPDALGSDRALAAERALLDLARTALGRGRADDAARAISKHAQSFPSGRLSEERASLEVAMFVARGQLEQARAAAARFHHLYPASLFGAGVDQLVNTIQ